MLAVPMLGPYIVMIVCPVGPQEELVEHGDVVGDEGGFVAAGLRRELGDHGWLVDRQRAHVVPGSDCGGATTRATIGGASRTESSTSNASITSNGTVGVSTLHGPRPRIEAGVDVTAASSLP